MCRVNQAGRNYLSISIAGSCIGGGAKARFFNAVDLSAEMRVIALIEDPAVIHRLLDHLALWDLRPSGPDPPSETLPGPVAPPCLRTTPTSALTALRCVDLGQAHLPLPAVQKRATDSSARAANAQVIDAVRIGHSVDLCCDFSHKRSPTRPLQPDGALRRTAPPAPSGRPPSPPFGRPTGRCDGLPSKARLHRAIAAGSGYLNGRGRSAGNLPEVCRLGARCS